MILNLKVVPGSSRNRVIGDMGDGTLKVAVAAPPEKGKANEAVCELLAEHFHVSKQAVRILSGQGTSRKRVEIQGI